MEEAKGIGKLMRSTRWDSMIEPTNRCLFSSARMYCDEISAENSEVCAGCHNRLASSQVIDLEALWPLEWFLEPLAGQLHSVTECSWDLVIQWMDVLREDWSTGCVL